MHLDTPRRSGAPSRWTTLALVASLALPASAPAESRWQEFRRRSGSFFGAVWDEVKLLPSTAYHFPRAYWDTAMSGAQRDSLIGTGQAVGETVVEEARFLPQWAPNLPGEYVRTAQSGEQLSSLAGGIQGGSDRITFGAGRIDMQPYRDTPEHQRAFDNGIRVGEAWADETAMTVLTAGAARGGSMAWNRGRQGFSTLANRFRRPVYPGPAHSRANYARYLEELEARQAASRGTSHATPAELQRMRSTGLDPNDIRYTQSTVNPSVRDIEASMLENGWAGDPIDVVRRRSFWSSADDVYTSLDNRRVMGAQRSGLGRVQARVHNPSDPLPGEWTRPGGRFEGLRTWDDAVRARTAEQGAGFPRYGNLAQPQVTTVRPEAGSIFHGDTLTRRLPSATTQGAWLGSSYGPGSWVADQQTTDAGYGWFDGSGGQGSGAGTGAGFLQSGGAFGQGGGTPGFGGGSFDVSGSDGGAGRWQGGVVPASGGGSFGGSSSAFDGLPAFSGDSSGGGF